VTAARTSRDTAIDARKKEAAGTLERELQLIRADGDARVAALEEQQKEYLRMLTGAGEGKFDEAVAVYQRIVCEVAS
jgi:hypothetical protein